MSYEQAMKHWKNHRKDRYYQPIVLGYFEKEKRIEDMNKEDILKLLDELDELRRKHKYDKHCDTEYIMRIACAIVAEHGGYSSRNDWTEILKADAITQYSHDLSDPLLAGRF